jgi:hypothetical protein
MEMWKEIENYDNYEISSKGYIKNKRTNKLLTPIYNKGYTQVRLNIYTKY